MNVYSIDWKYRLPLWINYGLPPSNYNGVVEVQAKTETQARQKFRELGYPSKSVGVNGYYKIEKVTKIRTVDIIV